MVDDALAAAAIHARAMTPLITCTRCGHYRHAVAILMRATPRAIYFLSAFTARWYCFHYDIALCDAAGIITYAPMLMGNMMLIIFAFHIYLSAMPLAHGRCHWCHFQLFLHDYYFLLFIIFFRWWHTRDITPFSPILRFADAFLIFTPRRSDSGTRFHWWDRRSTTCRRFSTRATYRAFQRVRRARCFFIFHDTALRRYNITSSLAPRDYFLSSPTLSFSIVSFLFQRASPFRFFITLIIGFSWHYRWWGSRALRRAPAITLPHNTRRAFTITWKRGVYAPIKYAIAIIYHGSATAAIISVADIFFRYGTLARRWYDDDDIRQQRAPRDIGFLSAAIRRRDKLFVLLQALGCAMILFSRHYALFIFDAARRRFLMMLMMILQLIIFQDIRYCREDYWRAFRHI